MNNSELHYVTYDPDAIWEGMMSAYRAEGGSTLYPGDEKEILLRAVLAAGVQMLAGVDNALRMQTRRYAVGEYLDIYGEGRDCERIAASKASVTLAIETNATGQALTLPAGTAFTADGVLFYLTTQELSLSGAAQTLRVQAEADRAGAAGNALLSGAALQPSAANAAIRKATAVTDAAGGSDEEDDETYRERIGTYGAARTTAGPSAQYELIARSVSSEIEDARALETGPCALCVYLILAEGSAPAALLQSVEEALSAKTVRPLTDHVSVAEAEAIPYTLELLYSVDSEQSLDSAAIEEAILAAAESWQSWQDGKIGRAFNPDRLMAAAYQAGALRVVWGEGSEFDGGAVEYTEIEPEQRCRGTVSVAPLS